ncbi:MAG: class I SAM-dependent methyltransferase, partial [Anaeroglobus sp.]
IHTDTAITLKAVDLGLHKISVNGIIMIVAYPGTPDGKKEKDELASFLSHVSQKRFDVSYWQPANQVHEPPVLFVIQKRG